MVISKSVLTKILVAAKKRVNEYVTPQYRTSERTGYYLALLDVLWYLRHGTAPDRWKDLLNDEEHKMP